MGNLFGDARAPAPRVTAFELKNGLNDLLTRTLRSWLSPRLGREEIPVFLLHKCRVDSEERGGTDGDGTTLDSATLDQLAPQGQEQSLDRREVRSALSGSIEHDELLLEEQIFGDDRPATAGLENDGDVSQKMGQYREQ